MNIINKFLCYVTPTHSYEYFDNTNTLSTKKLHIFQCIARKAFKWYAETHLTNVVQEGYRITLNGQFQGTPAKHQRLLQLICKADQLYGPNVSTFTLPDQHLSEFSTLGIKVRYIINAQATGIQHALFILRLDHSDNHTYEVKIFKNQSGKFVATLPHSRFKHQIVIDRRLTYFIKHADAYANIDIRNMTHEHSKTISDVVAKILSDSILAPEMAKGIHCYLADHRVAIETREDNQVLLSKPFTNPMDLNLNQDEAMLQLGWNYHDQYVDPTTFKLFNPIGQPSQRVYQLPLKKAQEIQKIDAFNLNLGYAAALFEQSGEENLPPADMVDY